MLSPSFKRIVFLAKNTGKAVSDMLDVSDKYEAFCLNEAADYLYISHIKRSKEEQDLKNLMGKHAKKKVSGKP